MFFFGLGSLLEIVLAHLVLPFFIFSSPVVRRLVNEQSDVMYRDYTLEENWMDRHYDSSHQIIPPAGEKGPPDGIATYYYNAFFFCDVLVEHMYMYESSGICAHILVAQFRWTSSTQVS